MRKLTCVLWITAILFVSHIPGYAQPHPEFHRHLSVEEIARYIGFNLHENIRSYIDKTSPVAYCTFVDIDDLEKTSSFGRMLGDSVGAFLSRKGYKVIETQLRDGRLAIRENAGQFGLTREMQSLRNDFQIQAILVGTYKIVDEESVYVSSRLINAVDNSILSSFSLHFPIHKSLLSLFEAGTAGHAGKKSSKTDAEESARPENGIAVLSLDNPADIRTVQKKLSELGLYDHRIDGIWGKRSEKALEYFKKAHGLWKGAASWDLRTQKTLFEATGY